MNSTVKISFITINYNSSAYTLGLITSIEQFTSLKYEIIVVDNASQKNDLIHLKNGIKNNSAIKLVQNNSNSGFSSGNMLGVTYASGEYLFFINNDTKLLNDAPAIVADYLDRNTDTALATAKIYDERGQFSSSYKLFPSLTKEIFGNSIARRLSKHSFPSNKIKLKTPTLVEVVSGSCMFFRATDFITIGGFNKDFFLYCEEEDISKRVWNHGKKVVFIPEAEIFHQGGGSSTKSFEMEREYYISYTILINQHFNKISIYLLQLLLLLKLFRRSFKKENGWKLFKCGLKGFSNEFSLRVRQD